MNIASADAADSHAELVCEMFLRDGKVRKTFELVKFREISPILELEKGLMVNMHQKLRVLDHS